MAYRSLIILAAAGTSTLNSADQDTLLRIDGYSPHGLRLVADFTAVGTLSAVLKIQGKDPLSGKYFDILTSAALTAIGTNVFTVFPGIAPIANVSVSDILPRIWRVNLAIAGAAPALTGTIYGVLK